MWCGVVYVIIPLPPSPACSDSDVTSVLSPPTAVAVDVVLLLLHGQVKAMKCLLKSGDTEKVVQWGAGGITTATAGPQSYYH